MLIYLCLFISYNCLSHLKELKYTHRKNEELLCAVNFSIFFDPLKNAPCFLKAQSLITQPSLIEPNLSF